MKKSLAALLLPIMVHANAATDASIETIVVGAPATDSNGGFMVLASADQKCRYYGDVWERSREPRGLVEQIKAMPRGGKIYEWVAVVRYSTCVQPDGTQFTKPVSLVSPAGKRFHVGDSALLRAATHAAQEGGVDHS